MKRGIMNRYGNVIAYEEATPVCGEDYCDTCGDCLDCYIEDDCCGAEGWEHLWVRDATAEELEKYEEEGNEDGA